ncbi:phosphatidylinositol 3-and 4-kinase domain-containing protein [Cyclospora cayetanensis]|uniref:Phosphatidylinositol 3-and 4-kinase domain-containing protein n=1 Tax=Cyclospora cayetanensis TaxID=88456 RepID=A0A1D3CY63_9EIME|nr:phosphatidylinositol 3-and 4-kinase domain-containing protein [Cyclospora cayetanensis]
MLTDEAWMHRVSQADLVAEALWEVSVLRRGGGFLQQQPQQQARATSRGSSLLQAAPLQAEAAVKASRKDCREAAHSAKADFGDDASCSGLLKIGTALGSFLLHKIESSLTRMSPASYGFWFLIAVRACELQHKQLDPCLEDSRESTHCQECGAAAWSNVSNEAVTAQKGVNLGVPLLASQLLAPSPIASCLW